jgi:hypothetical protein
MAIHPRVQYLMSGGEHSSDELSRMAKGAAAKRRWQKQQQPGTSKQPKKPEQLQLLATHPTDD